MWSAAPANMSFESAQGAFIQLLHAVEGESTRTRFLRWLRDDVLARGDLEHPVPESVLAGRRALTRVAEDLRERLGPKAAVSALLPSESVRTEANTVSVDAFLVDEEDEQRLVEEGRLSRAFCRKCGSRNTEMLGEDRLVSCLAWNVLRSGL